MNEVNSTNKVTVVRKRSKSLPNKFDRIHSLSLDPLIAPMVYILQKAGIQTYESCQGGKGHASPYPMVRFKGDQSEGLLALSVAFHHHLPVFALHWVWRMDNGELTGPWWDLEFYLRENDVSKGEECLK